MSCLRKMMYGLLRYFFNMCLQSNRQRAQRNGMIIDIKNMTLLHLAKLHLPCVFVPEP